MDEQRKGDLRVYVISALFFSCIVSGGVFLGLYMVLPENQSSSWYPVAGMILVSIPWAFWLFTFVYRCFKPLQPPPPAFNARFSKRAASEAPPDLSLATVDEDSPAPNSPAGERKVQFGPVVVLGSDDGAGEQRNESEVSNCSRESEMPLRSSV